MMNPESFTPSFNDPEKKEEKEKGPEKPHFDAVILFGGGLENPDEEFPDLSKEEIDGFIKDFSDDFSDRKKAWIRRARVVPNIRTKVRALGCLEILKEGDVDEIFITGGKVNPRFPSEAELMRDYIAQKYQQELKEEIEKENLTEKQAIEKMSEMIGKLKIEDGAVNTIENFANVINMMDRNEKSYDNIAFLSNSFHISRLNELGERFGLEGEELEAEEWAAKRSEGHRKLLKRACDPDNPVYEEMLKGETRWSRGLKEMPLYFLPQAVAVNEERLQRIYQTHKDEIDESLRKHGLDWEEFLELPEEERLKLRELPPEEWTEE